MILHDVADDAELVEVAATAFGAERFGERDENAGDVFSMPEEMKHCSRITCHTTLFVVISVIGLGDFETYGNKFNSKNSTF